jgi:heme/copper-type cytochrome/quinol oxidase subunit 2
MVVTAAVLWAGVPFGWLWVGSQVQAATDSLGTALLVMAAGVVASIALLMRLLGWLNLQHIHARERRGLETYGNVTLEGIMAVSAGLALVSFCIWFFLFSGSSPVPVNLGF